VYGDLTHDISNLCRGIDTVINFAGCCDVEHSLRDVYPYLLSNVVGTVNLLESARQWGSDFIQVSTDEVYGPTKHNAPSTECSRIQPNNPYAASKAAADAFVQSYESSGLLEAASIFRTNNVYGPYQQPYKALPTFVRKALSGEPIPVYGKGDHTRQWLYVTDLCNAIYQHAVSGSLSGVFNIGGAETITNLELAEFVLGQATPTRTLRTRSLHGV
jgi:dTDP-glucose 4,6-dehydratase